MLDSTSRDEAQASFMEPAYSTLSNPLEGREIPEQFAPDSPTAAAAVLSKHVHLAKPGWVVTTYNRWHQELAQQDLASMLAIADSEDPIHGVPF